MERSVKNRAAVVMVLIGIIFGTKNASAGDIYFINSDETYYRQDDVICNGNVIIMYEGRIIAADTVTYNQKNEAITAKGKVIIKDEKKNVYFLDSISINKDFRSGHGENIKIIMQDKSRLAAQRCILKDGKFELVNAVYTPCYDCLAFDELSWQLKAEHVSLDLEDTIDYDNLILETLGTGILYLPHLSLPSPKIKRKTGFLSPEFSISGKNGFSFLPRYFVNISDQQELILKPIVTQKIGSVGWIYYGSRFKNGEFNIDASITGTKSVNNINDDVDKIMVEKIRKSGYRGHVFSNFKYEINEIWRCDASVNLTSDQYYLRRFPFLQNNERVLESKGIIEGFDGNNYTQVKTSMFQTRYNDETPKALPYIERNFSTELFDGTLNFDLMFMNLCFHQGRRAQKGGGNIYWNKEFLAPYGNLFELKLLTSLKALNVNEKTHSDYDSFFDATPQVSLIWKWPLLLSAEFANAIFTPVFGVIAAGNKKHIDIFEDQFSELNEINFLEGEKNISQYNIDYGSRFCYGAKLSLFTKDGDDLAYFIIGRTTEITDLPEKIEATGLKYKNSNIVTSLDLFFNKNVIFIAKGSYSTNSKNWTRFESGVRANYAEFRAELLAFNGKQCVYNPFFGMTEEDRNEKYKGASFDLGWQTNKKLCLKAGAVFGGENNRLIKNHVGFEYKNECITVDVAIERTKYHSGDIRPETSFTFVINLKNLG